MELGSFGYRLRVADIPDGLPDQGRDVELPSRGLPRPIRDADADDDADALFQPECLGYCDHLGGGKLPPPTVPTMRHAGPVEGTKSQAPRHITVRKRHGTKEALNGRGKVEGYHGEGL